MSTLSSSSAPTPSYISTVPSGRTPSSTVLPSPQSIRERSVNFAGMASAPEGSSRPYMPSEVLKTAVLSTKL